MTALMKLDRPLWVESGSSELGWRGRSLTDDELAHPAMSSHLTGVLFERSYYCCVFDNRRSRPRTLALHRSLDLVKRGDPMLK